MGAAGPSADRDTRHEQLSKLSKARDREMDALDDRYYACKENVDALLAAYAVRHRDEFVRAAAGPGG